MRPWLFPLVLLALAACNTYSADDDKRMSVPAGTAQFWRPISEPNLLMPLEKVQAKLDFDVSQCHCGIYPINATHAEIVAFQADKQRLAQTGFTVTPDEDGQCVQQPSLVVTECMRSRGWEPTNCSGRMPLPGGGSLCTTMITP